MVLSVATCPSPVVKNTQTKSAMAKQMCLLLGSNMHQPQYQNILLDHWAKLLLFFNYCKACLDGPGRVESTDIGIGESPC